MNNYTFALILLFVFISSTFSCNIGPPKPPPVSPSLSDCRCGIPPVRGRIVGGKEVFKNEYPWLVALVQKGKSNAFCGGALISSRIVLTAAHCDLLPPSQFRVHVGEHDLTRSDGEQKMVISRWINHPDYNDVGNHDNDLAIIQLTSDVHFSDAVMPICLPSPSENFDDRIATVVGWGTTFFGGSRTTTPQKAKVETMTNSACISNSLYTKDNITDNMICARGPGKDACEGTSSCFFK